MLFIVVFVLINLYGYADSISSQGIIAHWGFEEGTGTVAKNLISGTLNATMKNVSYAPESVVGAYSLNFPNTGGTVTVNQDSQLDITDAITIAGWFKRNDTDTAKTNNVIINKNYSYSLAGIPNWCPYAYMTVYLSNNQMFRVFSKAVIDTGKWYHILGTYNSVTGKIKIYINGKPDNVLDVTNISDYKIAKTTNALEIGSTYSKQMIDDLYILNRVVSDDEAQILYLQGLSKFDAVSPTIPQNLKASLVSYSEVYLEWSASTDNDLVAGYEIYRNNIMIGKSAIGSYTDKNSEGFSSNYTIVAYDRVGNKSLPSSVVAAVSSQNIIIHPKLYFYSENIFDLRKKALTTHSDLWAPVIAEAEAIALIAPKKFSEIFTTATPTLNTFYNEGADIQSLAIAYIITGDTKYAEACKQRMVEYSTWSAWGDDGSFQIRDLGLSAMIIGNSVAYDWIYDYLSQADRDKIRNAIIKHAGEQYEAATTNYLDAWNNWWGKSYAQNHCLYNNSAVGVAALALNNETANAQIWLDQAIKIMKIDKSLEEGIGDGTWHEGVQYQNMKLLWTLPFYHNLLRLKGMDLFSDNYLKNFVMWKAYNYIPNSKRSVMAYSSYYSLQSNESNSYGGHSFLRFIASRYKDGYSQWLADALIKEYKGTGLTKVYKKENIYDFLYFDSSVLPKTTASLPLTRTFSDSESVIWKSGWSATDLTFAFKSGAYGGRFMYEKAFNKLYPFEDVYRGNGLNVGHNHGDANSFYLYKGNSDLASELPDKDVLYDSRAHNTILIDDKPQFQYRISGHDLLDKYINPAPTDARLEEVHETQGYSFLISDATNRYRENLSGKPGNLLINQFKRHVLFVKPGYFVILDDIKANQTHKYDWVCNFGKMTLTKENTGYVEGNWLRLNNSSEILGVKIVEPTNFSYEFGANFGCGQYKQFVKVRPSSNVADTRFISVLYPTNETNWNNKPEILYLGSNNEGAGISVKNNGTEDHIMKYGASTTAIVGQYTLTGKAASVAKDLNNKVTKLFMAGGKEFKDGDTILVRAVESNVTVDAVFSANSLAITGKNDINNIIFYAPDTDKYRVTLNGTPVNATKTGNYIILGTIDIDLTYATDRLLGDFNNDNAVDLADFVEFARSYGTYNSKHDIAPATLGTGNWAGIYSKCIPDANVNLTDFIVFARNYGLKPFSTLPLMMKRQGSISKNYYEKKSVVVTDGKCRIGIKENSLKESTDGFEFVLKYNPDELEFKNDSVTALGNFKRALVVGKENKKGEIIIALSVLTKKENLSGDILEIGFIPKNRVAKIVFESINVRGVYGNAFLNNIYVKSDFSK